MKWVMWPVALACIVLGLMTVWLPIPTGVPLLATGMFLIIANHRRSARFVRKQRQAMPRFNRGLSWIEDKTTGYFSRVLRRTRPRKKAVEEGSTPNERQGR